MSLSGAPPTAAPGTEAVNSTSKGELGASTAASYKPYVLTPEGGRERVWSLTPDYDYICPISFV